MLDSRLTSIADAVTFGGTLCDIGTDHCYLPIELAAGNKIKKAYASDISEVNLQKAKDNIKSYENRHGKKLNIELVLSNGLKELESYRDITDISISGMGGENIAAIIKDSATVKRGVKLLLQPNSKTEFLRGFLYTNGFEITKEVLSQASNYTYVTIISQFTEKDCDFPLFPTDNLIGTYLNHENSPYFSDYLEKTINRMEKILTDLEKAEDTQKATEFGTQNNVKSILSALKRRRKKV